MHIITDDPSRLNHLLELVWGWNSSPECSGRSTAGSDAYMSVLILRALLAINLVYSIWSPEGKGICECGISVMGKLRENVCGVANIFCGIIFRGTTFQG